MTSTYAFLLFKGESRVFEQEWRRQYLIPLLPGKPRAWMGWSASLKALNIFALTYTSPELLSEKRLAAYIQTLSQILAPVRPVIKLKLISAAIEISLLGNGQERGVGWQFAITWQCKFMLNSLKVVMYWKLVGEYAYSTRTWQNSTRRPSTGSCWQWFPKFPASSDDYLRNWETWTSWLPAVHDWQSMSYCLVLKICSFNYSARQKY